MVSRDSFVNYKSILKSC